MIYEIKANVEYIITFEKEIDVNNHFIKTCLDFSYYDIKNEKFYIDENEIHPKHSNLFTFDYIFRIDKNKKINIKSSSGSYLITICEKKDKRYCKIITFANNKYQNALLSLISSIYKYSYFCISSIIIFYIDIDEDIKNTLINLPNIILINYKTIIDNNDFEYSVLDLKYYAFKTFCINYAYFNLCDNNDKILYLDAGININRNLNEIIRLIDKNDLFVVDHSDRKNGQYLRIANITHPNCVKNMGLIQNELEANVVKGGIFGIKVGGIFENFLKEWYNLSKKKNIMCYSKFENMSYSNYFNDSNLTMITSQYTGHRHDQTILSILIKRYKCKIGSGRKYAYSVDSGISKNNLGANKIAESGKLIKIQNQTTRPYLLIHRGLKIDISYLFTFKNLHI